MYRGDDEGEEREVVPSSDAGMNIGTVMVCNQLGTYRESSIRHTNTVHTVAALVVS